MRAIREAIEPSQNLRNMLPFFPVFEITVCYLRFLLLSE
jgi:hypothetical protein